MYRKLLMVALAVLMSACATTKNREIHSSLVKSVEKQDYAAAVQIVESKDFFPEKRSELLRHLEKATAYYLDGRYRLALNEFDAARNLSDEQYTKSISAAASSIVDANRAEFYGARYERSKIRFYQTLLHYKLAKIGRYEAYVEEIDKNKIKHPEAILTEEEKRFHLTASRNVMQEWHSMFAQYRMETEDKPTYKADLMEHLWGAFVHEQTGDPSDRQIALVLYRQAKEVLFHNYNIYSVFNRKHEKFVKSFYKFSEMDIAIVEQDYVDPTDFNRELVEYIDAKIDQLNEGRRDNVVIVLKDGLVAEKKAKEYRLNFSAAELMGLAYLGAYIAAATGSHHVLEAGFYTWAVAFLLNDITYDMPYIEYKEAPRLEVSMADSSGRSINIPLVLVSPVSDIAFKEINDKVSSERAALITRLIGEYVGAAAVAYLMYKQIIGKDKSPSGLKTLFAQLAAIATFKGLGVAIEAHNKADIRQWKLLPSNIRLGSAELEPGDYVLTVWDFTYGQPKVVYQQSVDIGTDTAFIDINL